ncbi:hypothetical protein BACIH_3626 [Bacillus amyloliquefaciens]|nr:hypothetical protein U471_36460 [Bacillus amyloliquefaciens CC178]QEY89962.1 hypothetical protein BACIT_2067 [Bacillus amyloliquefaciens]QEY95303.1 hypothetical protein BACIH_3626 [Bacillus amyloliquefaciens]
MQDSCQVFAYKKKRLLSASQIKEKGDLKTYTEETLLLY